MKISTRGRYGVRLLIDLAERRSTEQGGAEIVTLSEIGERQHISVRYLEQVAVLLRRAGYIRSLKGPAGGFSLIRAPETITVGEVLRILEGDILIVDPPAPGEKESPLQRCIRTAIYDRLNARIARLLDTTTIASIIGTVDPDESYMYFI